MADKDVILTGKGALKEGEMKAFKVDGGEILLGRLAGQFYAVAAQCTHYGGQLEHGILSGNRIVCPLHHATFDLMTGKMLEPPALDGLPSYKVRIENDNVIVTIPEGALENRKVCETSNRNIEKDDRCFVIIGAGAAGNSATQALREYGYQGRIVMLTRESYYPYDRPELSKGYLAGHSKEEWLPLRPPDFYKNCNIEIMFNKEVIGLNTEHKMVSLNTADSLIYDSLLIASGGVPRKLQIPDSNLSSVFTLRSRGDMEEIIAHLSDSKRVAVIGASFIAIETAAGFRERGKDVTIIAPESMPFENILGKQVGGFFKNLHESMGIKFKLEANVKAFEGDGHVENVILNNGKKIAAEIVLVGIGVDPATGFKSDLALEKDGGIRVDEYFRHSPNVYAAGDIARFPYWYTGEYVRIEHWRVAEQQGRIAAANMLGIKTAYDGIPFFWTRLFDINFRYVGYAKDWDDVIIDGDIRERNFIAYYARKNRVLAAAGVNRDKELAAIEEMMRANKMPSADKLGIGKAAEVFSS